MMNENADNKARAIDAIIAEESSKNSFYPQSPDLEAEKKLSFINNPESASKTLKASI